MWSWTYGFDSASELVLYSTLLGEALRRENLHPLSKINLSSIQAEQHVIWLLMVLFKLSQNFIKIHNDFSQYSYNVYKFMHAIANILLSFTL